ncbi:hypothetical protein L6452_28049 [Arctium lappa]|uniref:Uncharacterized protein n=1 Tax=Arctium lappa TaxID=4217 RepID=A0ACB8ZY67_ARCLA|nr:hypothetical protein L6452_28049 [Arctium lappa]
MERIPRHAPWKNYRSTCLFEEDGANLLSHQWAFGMCEMIAFDPSNQWFCTGSADRTIKVWDIRSKTQIYGLSGHHDTVCSVFTRPTDPQVVTGSHDSTIKFWDLRYGTKENFTIEAAPFCSSSSSILLCVARCLVNTKHYSVLHQSDGHSDKMGLRNCLWVLLFRLSTFHCQTQTIINSLPGFPGLLPFNLQTGYIGVGENESVQLFYYFVESEVNPEDAPLVFWLAGGPGCSALRAFFFEIGPLEFEYGEYRDNVPALRLNPNSWTKLANMMYLDAPTITGFSYTKTTEAIVSSDILSASQTTEFIRKFVRNHPKFLNNPMYVAGMSYSGVVIPMITEEIYRGNDAGLKPTLNIKGYMAGNPLTDKAGDVNSRLEFAYRMALISYELFESTHNNCNGEYANANTNNLPCMADITEVNKRVEDINILQILDPGCDSKTDLLRDGNTRRGRSRKSPRLLRARLSLKDVFCRDDNYKYAAIWANDRNVMKALNVHEGTVKEEWSVCNADMTYNYGKASMPAYKFDVQNSVIYHANLTKRNCRALIFSGDHDMTVPHVGTRNWILSLNLTITDSNWEAWYANGQEAGYKTTYVHDNYSLVFATVKGAGHTSPEYKPEECFEMVDRWLAHLPI